MNKKYLTIFSVDGLFGVSSFDGVSSFCAGVLLDVLLLFDGFDSSFFGVSTLLEDVFSFDGCTSSSFFLTLTIRTSWEVLPEESETVYIIFCSPILEVSISS